MFVLDARYAGETRQIGWDDGQLSGDALLVRAIEEAALEAVGRELGPVGGPYSVTDHLASSFSFSELVGELAGWNVRLVSGTPPVRPGIPEGAIG